MLSLLFSPFFLLAALCGILIFFCFRTQKTSHRLVLILAVVACLFILYASTNPIPGNEGPGLLALMVSGVAAGTAVILLIVRLLPKPLPIPRSPAVRLSGWLLGTFGIGAVAAFAVAVLGGANFEGAALSVTVLIPVLWGFSGWLMPKANHPKRLCTTVAVLLLWSILTAAVIYWSSISDSMYATWFSLLTLTHRTAYPILFSSLAYGPKTAFELNVLCPLAISSIQFLLTAAFGIGMLVKYQEVEK